MSTELDRLREKVKASKEIFKILKEFDSEEIFDLFARNVAKVLCSAPSPEEQKDFLKRLEKEVLEIVSEGNINQVIVYQEDENSPEKRVDFEEFEIIFEELNK